MLTANLFELAASDLQERGYSKGSKGSKGSRMSAILVNGNPLRMIHV